MEEEKDELVLTVETVGWPEDLAGIRITEQLVYNQGDKVTIIGEPIWLFDPPLSTEE